MNFARVLLRGRWPTDDRLDDDEGRSSGLVLRGGYSVKKTIDVLRVVLGVSKVDGLDVPSIRRVAGGYILAEGNIDIVLDRDLVCVVQDHQVAELLVASQRRGLCGDSLLQVTVTSDDVNVVVKGRLAGCGVGVKQSALKTLRIGKTGCRRNSLTERTRCDLHVVGVTIFGVAGGERAPGAQCLEVVEFEPATAQEELNVLGQ